MKKDTRLILALDVLSEEKALELVSSLEGRIDYVKVGYPLILAAGLDIVHKIAKTMPVIADLKVADIPNTNTLISKQVLSAGAKGLIAHAFVGKDSLQACVNAAKEHDALIFAVTEMSHPGAKDFMAPMASKLAQVAIEAGADGVVAPATRPERIELVRSTIGDKVIISPGVGTQGGSPRAALDAGADYLIVGRSITGSKNPRKAADDILDQIR